MAINFEDLDCWKTALELEKEIFKLVINSRINQDSSLKNQMLRSVGSVADNIAEGFERNGNKEFLQFLFIAKGSCGELRSQIHRAYSRQYLSSEEANAGLAQCRLNSIKIMKFITTIRNSGMVGHKFYVRNKK